MEAISRGQESKTQNPNRMLRSMGAVAAGFVVVVILSLGTDVLLHVTSVFPPWGQPMADAFFVLATVYRILYGIVGSYITARLALDRPLQHAMAGGVAGLIISIVGAAVTWNKGPEFGPHWYPLALVVTALPCAWAGGKLRMAQLRAHAAS
jgi:surface polysaccharide O-acyltransferase-like enzyme